MSTASRNCGTICYARARNRNAVSAPGVSGKTRWHYDRRATRYTDGDRACPVMRSKREPEAEIAAHGRRAVTPFEYSGLRGPRLRHSPPPFFLFAHPPPATPPPVKETARDGLSPR